MRVLLLKYFGIELRSLQIVPGLTSLFFSISIFLCIYILLTLLIAIAALQYLPLTYSSNKILFLLGVILLAVSYSYFLLTVFRKVNPFVQLTIAFFTGLFYATVIGTLVLMIIFNDYFIIQDQLLQVHLNGFSQSNFIDSLIQRLNSLWNGDEGQPSFLILVFIFGITTLMLPWVVCVRFASSSDFRSFRDFNKIQQLTI